MSDPTPTNVKIEEAKAKIESGQEGQPSRLSVDVAQKTTYWSQILATPTGKLAVAQGTALLLALIAWVTGALNGDKKISDFGPIQIEIVKMPKLIASNERIPAEPIPLPVQAKPFGLVTFSATVPPLDQPFWDAYRARGFRIDHYSSSGPESQAWASLISKAGGGDVLIITDTKNFLGGAKLTDKAAAAATIAKFAADK